jgi:membrane associated rhomboid family serine protease
MTEYETRMQLAFPPPSKLFTPVVTVILIALVLGFAVAIYAPEFTISFLAISSQGMFRGRIWQFITYPLVNPSVCSLVFNGLAILFIGSAIEREWRSRSFLALWLVVSVACGLIWVLVGLILGQNLAGLGAAACGYGIIATFGILYRGKRFYFFFATIEAQYLAIILIVIGLVVSIAQPFNLIWVAGAGVAYLYVMWRMQIKRGRLKGDSLGSRGPSGFVDID